MQISEIPALDTSAETQIVALVHELTGNARSRQGLLRHRGVAVPARRDPTVVCGPGSIEQAHKPNEFIALEQVEACEKFLRRLMERMTCRRAT